MFIILDTNVFVSDFNLTGTLFQTLFEGLSYIPDKRIAIPELVFDETIQKYKEALEGKKGKLNNAINDYNELIKFGQGGINPLEFNQYQVSEYKDFLRKSLEDNEAIFLPYPEQSHFDVARRAMEKIPPFHRKKEGYRDYLIWLTVLNAFELDKQVTFITSNKYDFGENSTLLPEFMDDIIARKIDPSNLKFFSSPRTFIEIHIKPIIEEMSTAEINISSGKLPWLDIHQWLKEVLPRQISKINPTKFVIEFLQLQGIDDYCVEKILEVHNIDIKGMNRFKNGDLLLWALASVEALVSFPIPHTSLSENYFPDFVLGEQKRLLVVEFEVVINMDEQKVSSPYIHEVEEFIPEDEK